MEGPGRKIIVALSISRTIADLEKEEERETPETDSSVLSIPVPMKLSIVVIT